MKPGGNEGLMYLKSLSPTTLTAPSTASKSADRQQQEKRGGVAHGGRKGGADCTFDKLRMQAEQSKAAGTCK